LSELGFWARNYALFLGTWKCLSFFEHLFNHNCFLAVVFRSTVLRGDWGTIYNSPLLLKYFPSPIMCTFAMCHHKEVPLGIQTKIIFMAAEVDEILYFYTVRHHNQENGKSLSDLSVYHKRSCIICFETNAQLQYYILNNLM
jgi:hypothetical protein